jgi:dipeptidyl-peptidase 4
MTRFSKITSILTVLAFASTNAISAAPKTNAHPEKLTVDRIFNAKEFTAKSHSVNWLPGKRGYTRLIPAKGGGSNIMRYTVKSKTGKVMVSAEDLTPAGSDAPLKIEGYAFSKGQSLVLIYTNSKRVWRKNTRGDYWLLDRGSRELRKLGGEAPPSSLMFAEISPDGHSVAYVRERNVYVEDIRDHSIRQITKTESSRVINGTADWVYEEELFLRKGYRWSPDSKSIAYWQIDDTGVQDMVMVDNLSGLYPKLTTFAYPKVGQRNPICRIGVHHLETGKLRWMNTGTDLRDNYLARMDWAKRSSELLIQKFNRKQNTNQVLLASAKTGETKTIITETDAAWVNAHNELHRIGKGQFTWISERDGWRQIYLVKRNGKTTPVTTGKFDVISLLQVDQRKQALYFIASPDNPAERYLYRIGFDGQSLQRITPKSAPAGSYDYRIAPDGTTATVSFSTIDTPPTTELVSLPEHKTIRSLETNDALRKKLKPVHRTETEFAYIKIGKDQSLHSWCIKPPDFDPQKKYPLLMFVYGEPAGQTVRNRWGGTRHLWHQMLAQRGFVVMTIDNPGTAAPRGREWRKSVYKKVGILAPKAQAEAVRALLKERKYLDPKRVGTWGWSGGGSMSLNAIFKYPKIYSTAIAIASVPNQRFYDSIYQERYMGPPEENVDGYREGSPINFAHQLEGNLLIVHGTGDDNCHYQTFEQLVDQLIRHNKQFSMMAYPNRTHSIREGKNTTRHLFSLMTDYLDKNLLRKPGG